MSDRTSGTAAIEDLDAFSRAGAAAAAALLALTTAAVAQQLYQAATVSIAVADTGSNRSAWIDSYIVSAH